MTSIGVIKERISGTLEWLKSDVQTDLEWTVKSQELECCLVEMESAPPRLPAVPHIQAMLVAMWSRNRRRAFDSGVDALAEL